jgi:hypothetical protein
MGRERGRVSERDKYREGRKKGGRESVVVGVR